VEESSACAGDEERICCMNLVLMGACWVKNDTEQRNGEVVLDCRNKFLFTCRQ
jgi:hypothetical protein